MVIIFREASFLLRSGFLHGLAAGSCAAAIAPEHGPTDGPLLVGPGARCTRLPKAHPPHTIQ